MWYFIEILEIAIMVILFIGMVVLLLRQGRKTEIK